MSTPTKELFVNVTMKAQQCNGVGETPYLQMTFHNSGRLLYIYVVHASLRKMLLRGKWSFVNVIESAIIIRSAPACFWKPNIFWPFKLSFLTMWNVQVLVGVFIGYQKSRMDKLNLFSSNLCFKNPLKTWTRPSLSTISSIQIINIQSHLLLFKA